MRQSYYRPGVTRALWAVGIALALALACWFAARATVAVIRADERAKVMQDGDALLRQTMAAAEWIARERDSLRAVVRGVDTVLVTRLRTVRDTSWMPADTSPVVRLAACRLALDSLVTDCARFRETATAALAAADAEHAADSSAAVGMAQQLAAIRRADSIKTAGLATAGKWRWVERGACAGSVAANLFLMRR